MPLYVFAAFILIEIDQLVKAWALRVLRLWPTIPVIQDKFHLTYLENRGAAFSLFAQFDSRWVFVVLAVVITAVILYVLRKQIMQTALGSWSLVLIAAGALGNAIDRVMHGFVVDMFDFRIIHFPVFNVADIFITVGGVLFVLYVLFQHKEEKAEKRDEAQAAADEQAAEAPLEESKQDD